jgi:hypothetical protein
MFRQLQVVLAAGLVERQQGLGALELARSLGLARDQHVSSCRPDDRGTCIANAGVIGVRSGLRRTQSFQVRDFDGHGNPIIGGVTWDGSAFPREVLLSCDLRVKEVAKSCRVEKIAS